MTLAVAELMTPKLLENSYLLGHLAYFRPGLYRANLQV